MSNVNESINIEPQVEADIHTAQQQNRSSENLPLLSREA